MFLIRFSKQAEKDKKKLKSMNLDGKTKSLLNAMCSNPFINPPPYEKLVGNLEGFYSRRINIQHRLIYEVIETPTTYNGIGYIGTIKIVSMWSHYEI